MGFFSKTRSGSSFMDEIRCDEPSYLIWKWHPAGTRTGEANRENAIRWGSSLRVKDGEVAVFVYKQKMVSCKITLKARLTRLSKQKIFPFLQASLD